MRTLDSVGMDLERRGGEGIGASAEARSTRPAREWEVVRQRPELLAEGALACPGCELPIALGRAMPPSEGLDCPYCRRRGRASEFLRLGAAGPRGSRVAVVASF
jgi:hypothetical protein